MSSSKQFKQWIDRELERMKPGDFLPSGTELARMWGLSERTVFEIMRSLARRGRIERIRGKGSRVPVQSPSPVRNIPESKPSEHTISRTIKREIFNGTLKSGDALPPRKRMSLQFGVAPRMVSKAYQQLVDENLVVNIGRRFWVGRFSRLMKTGMSRDVVFFDCTKTGWREALKAGVYGDMYRKAEHVLTTGGFRVFYHDFASFDALVEKWYSGNSFPQGLLLAGMQANNNYHDFKHVDRLLRRYFRRRSSVRAPSVVIASPSSYGEMCSMVKSLAGSRPTTIAREAARFIVEKHYRRATVFFNEDVMGNRPFFDYIRLWPELKNLRDDFDLHFVVRNGRDTSIDSFVNRLGTHYTTHLNLNYLHICLDKYGPVPLQTVLDNIVPVERFDTAFESREGDRVWLFSTDADAAEALQWCRARRIRVPEDRAVLGFENNPAFLHHGITSVILDKETIGYNLAHALLDDIPVERSSQGYLRMKALVLERMTM